MLFRSEGEKGAAVEDAVSEGILRGLGGKKNISDVDCCATRLRCTVVKSELVNDAVLKATGATGVVHKGNGVQIIYGPKVTVIKSNFEDYLETAPNEEISTVAEEVETTPTTTIQIQLVFALPCKIPNKNKSINPPENVIPTPTFKICINI